MQNQPGGHARQWAYSRVIALMCEVWRGQQSDQPPW